ncbi:MAG: hypothetical protein P1P64_03280 [Treponemataceae bacterium]
MVSVLPADVFGFEMGMTKEEVEKQCKTIEIHSTEESRFFFFVKEKKVIYSVVPASNPYDINFKDYKAIIGDKSGLSCIVATTSSHSLDKVHSELKKLCEKLSEIYGKYEIMMDKSEEGSNDLFYAVFQNKLPDKLSYIYIGTETFYSDGFLGLGAGEKIKFNVSFVFKNAKQGVYKWKI